MNLRAGLLVAVLAVAVVGAGCQRSREVKPRAGPMTVEVDKTIARLIVDEDVDKDKKITIDDKSDKKFVLEGTGGERALVSGTYPLSVLLQELSLAKDRGDKILDVTPAMINEKPADRLSRLIREKYWDALTRRIDADHIKDMLRDEKQTSGGVRYIYVPNDDLPALQHFQVATELHPEWKLQAVRLPETITADYVRSLDGKHGLLSLELIELSGVVAGVPFVVPGGRFNEMYGWDSYFESLGLIPDGRDDLAKSMVDNFVYEIDHYGKILNANRSYYLTRSQPPFLTSMALAVYDEKKDREWLREVFRAAVKEYRAVWTGPERMTDTGLSRYFDSGKGPCPEVEPGHYDYVVSPYAKALGISPDEYLRRFTAGEIKEPKLDSFFIHDRAVRESGHDTTYRFDNRTADFVSVDLNSLLYKIETDIANTIENEFGGELALDSGSVETPGPWRERAAKRKEIMNQLMWDPERGMFFDYDYVNKNRSAYVSATTFYPMWAGLASKEQAESLVQNALPLLECAGGVASTSEASRGPVTDDRPQRQWDYPNGWAPHQMLIWKGLQNYGCDKDARRLAYKWLYMITRNAVDYNGVVPEKYDVVAMSHQVFAEYGNVGTKFSYITREGFGWMNASYQAGLAILSSEERDALNRLEPPSR